MSAHTFIQDDGLPDIGKLQSTFGRCSPYLPGGMEWLDNVRFCRWPSQSTDGKKHDTRNDPKGAALPWDGASDCRPFVVDAAIQERAAMKTTAFWRAMLRPGMGGTEASSYAVALAEHLMGSVLYDDLTREVELSAQYEEHYGWMILAPRWRRELGLRHHELSMEYVLQLANEAPADSPLRQLPVLLMDPTLEAQAIELMRSFYQTYVVAQLPEDLRERAPQISTKTLRRTVRDLRTTGKAKTPLPYVCRDEPGISALKPWDEVFIPPEMVDEQTLVFQREWVNESELRGRILTEGYDEAWVEAACEFKGTSSPMLMPTGTFGNALSTLGGTTPIPMQNPIIANRDTGLVEIIHAVYRDVDDDGVPVIYCTTFHRAVGNGGTARPSSLEPQASLYAKHEQVEGAQGELPYVAGVREWWCRNVTASRGVPEVSHTHQNLIKGVLDATIDRMSLTTLPPVNVYESPTGTQYRFGPAQQNYVRQGREPQFMQTPSGSGMADAMNTYQLVRSMVDNYHGLLAADVPPVRLQMAQAMTVQRFLLVWSKALQQILCLCQKHMKDVDFAEITGAPAGWLDGHRDDRSALKCELHFDVKELDPELVMEQIKAVNTVVLPSDVLGSVNRGKWTRTMLRCINPAWARELVVPEQDASQQLFDRAKNEVLQMFAGNQPQFLEDKDPTAAGLLQFTMQVLQSNPKYLAALTDEALIAVLGQQQAQQLAQQFAQMRSPDERFSGLLVKWIENLKFVGDTQVENKQIGRLGVNPNGQ